jgi:hypothetical protein
VDPLTAVTSTVVGETLAGYRADPRVGGGISFATNAVLLQGLEHTLRVGQAVASNWHFE